MDSLRLNTIELPSTGDVEGSASPASDSGNFSNVLGKAIDDVDKLQVEADGQATKVAEGGGNLHETALALEKADISMRLLTKVKNKLVDAYQEVMRMSI
jgi:flagellar hook-basal body complex protein FliE